jgi:two-component system, OmpR family, sensor histidine kinase BaeS
LNGIRCNMRSLASKLTLAFLLVGLSGAGLVAVVLRNQTRDAFDQFILTREQQVLVENLLWYYQTHRSWDGLHESLGSSPSLPAAPSSGRRDTPREWYRFTLVGLDRTVVISSQSDQVGQVVAARDLERAILVKDGDETVGWLFLSPFPREWVPNSPEAVFLANLNQATRLSSLVAVGLALLLGSLLAYTLTRTLRDLTDATVEIAGGKLGRQVKVRSRDELGELASSFNKMSADLARATQARRQMTADIAHELRSPLSVISGYAEALSDGKLPGTPEVYDILYQETQNLNRQVDDLRTLSLADAGELPLERQPVAPKDLLERVAARHRLAAESKSIALTVEAGQDLPVVSADPERLAQVLDNLIGNAFRYTSSGGQIGLFAHLMDDAVQLQVRDSGSGIPPQDLPYIFDRFYRGDKARQAGGESGLGLAIAKSIVEALGGSITAESLPGEGSVFSINLPKWAFGEKLE